ncbi:MAG: 2Fe-2S iron-sulfur cluster binding domain-containing protein [Acidobacteria bacterium]|nr:2Fe-2S iron-sulfur cluster binding domain-containing protein [Acidobacteriota bacterium]
MDGVAPAILNAVENATGLSLSEIPLDFTGRSAGPAGPAAPEAAAAPVRGERKTIVLTVNGQRHVLQVYPMARLLDVLREHLRLTGTKEGCGEGECGACAILIDGELVNSCLVPALQADGTQILTIEGVPEGDRLARAFLACGGAQCGICTPGMVMAALSLRGRNPNPSEEEIREGLAGNLCRCTGYMKIIEACRGL